MTDINEMAVTIAAELVKAYPGTVQHSAWVAYQAADVKRKRTQSKHG